ncbi:helix-turn-helix transcriptional regulator [Rhabdothermincola salaria]|uniref:helix-turn-helix transcriptional regulator n=1 Tax=Rhabdothermincola salaria TaxID=2903142 RepID=UPI001E295139|nr:helix-turn-helix domain-containing protein [Rhabdothermincola salaria]
MTTLQVQARALGDPTRHRLFRYIADAPSAVGVVELTDHVGLNHNAVRQHLAKLVDAGLVTEATARPAGPGRPRLVYRVDPTAASRWEVPGPYERLAQWLSEVIRTGQTPAEIGRLAGRAEHERGPSEDDPIAELTRVMARQGFDPIERRRGSSVDLVLQNCPFETTALADPATVCQLHHGLAVGVADAIGGVVVDDLVAKDPRRAGCRLRCHLDESTLDTTTGPA